LLINQIHKPLTNLTPHGTCPVNAETSLFFLASHLLPAPRYTLFDEFSWTVWQKTLA